MKTSVKIYFTIFMLTWLAFSCTEDEPEKSVVLQKLIGNVDVENCACLPYINEYVWENKTVYVKALKGPACNWVPAYYDENGVELNMEEGYTYDEFLEDSILVENVWTCQE
ncbi:MAG: hypothetical protein WD426_13870 [Anditalea sp.]